MVAGLEASVTGALAIDFPVTVSGCHVSNTISPHLSFALLSLFQRPYVMKSSTPANEILQTFHKVHPSYPAAWSLEMKSLLRKVNKQQVHNKQQHKQIILFMPLFFLVLLLSVGVFAILYDIRYFEFFLQCGKSLSPLGRPLSISDTSTLRLQNLN